MKPVRALLGMPRLLGAVYLRWDQMPSKSLRGCLRHWLRIAFKICMSMPYASSYLGKQQPEFNSIGQLGGGQWARDAYRLAHTADAQCGGLH